MALQVRLDPRALQRHIGQQPATPYALSVSGAAAQAIDTTGTVPGTIATSFPQTPADGDEIDVLVDATNSVCWRFRYFASLSLWVFIGGGPMYAIVATGESSASTTFGDLATVGPSLTPPRSGTYIVGMSARMSNNSASNGAQLAPTSPTLGAASATNGIKFDSASAGSTARLFMQSPPVSLSAGETLKLQYSATGGGTATFLDRRIFLTPISVS